MEVPKAAGPWLDRQVGGLVDRRMCGLRTGGIMDGWTARQMGRSGDGWVDRWTVASDLWAGGRMNVKIGRWMLMDGQTGGWADVGGRVDGQRDGLDGRADRWTEASDWWWMWMDGQTGGWAVWTDGWLDGQVDG